MSVLSIEIPDSMYDRFHKTNAALAITLSNGDSINGYGWYVRGMVELIEEIDLHSGEHTSYSRRFEVTARTEANFGSSSTLPEKTLLFPHEYPQLRQPYSTCGNCQNFDGDECISKRRRRVDSMTRADSCVYYREVHEA